MFMPTSSESHMSSFMHIVFGRDGQFSYKMIDHKMIEEKKARYHYVFDKHITVAGKEAHAVAHGETTMTDALRESRVKRGIHSDFDDLFERKIVETLIIEFRVFDENKPTYTTNADRVLAPQEDPSFYAIKLRKMMMFTLAELKSYVKPIVLTIIQEETGKESKSAPLPVWGARKNMLLSPLMLPSPTLSGHSISDGTLSPLPQTSSLSTSATASKSPSPSSTPHAFDTPHYNRLISALGMKIRSISASPRTPKVVAEPPPPTELDLKIKLEHAAEDARYEEECEAEAREAEAEALVEATGGGDEQVEEDHAVDYTNRRTYQ